VLVSGRRKEVELVDVDITVKMTIKDFPKQAVENGFAKDCAKIIIAEGLRKAEYSCDIQEVTIDSVKGD
jgi:hypothetical protein